jgi:hypothetical protein
MIRDTEFRRCKCGHELIVYMLTPEPEYKPNMYRYFDRNSDDYTQVFVCPECHDRLDYRTLEG